MVERSLSMREALGSMPSSSNFVGFLLGHNFSTRSTMQEWVWLVMEVHGVGTHSSAVPHPSLMQNRFGPMYWALIWGTVTLLSIWWASSVPQASQSARYALSQPAVAVRWLGSNTVPPRPEVRAPRVQLPLSTNASVRPRGNTVC